MLTRQFAISVFILSAQIAFAQNYQDCDKAAKVCGQGITHFNFPIGANNQDTGVNGSCVTGEANSTWITWTIIQGGWMTFNLIPDSNYQDLNFVLYKIPSFGDCVNKQEIRCMASGENIGAPFSSWEPCTGVTGIAAGQSDTEEGPGCSPGDNNLLAAHIAETGDHYVMLVNNTTFSSGGAEAGFSIQFGGAVSLDCTDIVSSFNNIANTNEGIRLSPNLSNGITWLEFESEEWLGSELQVFNLLGQKVFTQNQITQKRTLLELSHLSKGHYYVLLRKNHRSTLGQFVIIN